MYDDPLPQSPASIELKGISRRVGRHFSLENISLRVRQGEILGLIGHTGAGKSSLLRVIAGLDAPDSGDIDLGGIQATRTLPHKRGVAMVFQRDVFYPGQPLERDRLEAARAGVFDRWRAVGISVEEILQELEFSEELFSQPPETLSGGQGRRASLLRAMFRDTPILLADEPLAGLDLWTRDRVARLLWRFVRATGKSLVVVAHEPVEAVGLADRLAVLHKGRLVQTGRPAELTSKPGHRVVVSLLQYPPWNDLTKFASSKSKDSSGLEMVLIPPANCRVDSEPVSEMMAIPVRMLRRRWSIADSFLEWVSSDTGEVLRTPDKVDPPASGWLSWEERDEVRFGCNGQRL
ncbi:ATP-binding cassette domain-containing protein [bacterium]|nr:ATP-binding cassette domain-containing protein [bacterium]